MRDLGMRMLRDVEVVVASPLGPVHTALRARVSSECPNHKPLLLITV